ncbi:MAG: TadE/TadG family type IV pilus assembly protein [Actinomycetota bacterium]
MRRIRDERGASAVEFAIIASLLLLILFGTITFGITFNRIQGLQSSAREGARLGSLSQTTVDQIVTRSLESVSILNQSNFKTGGGGGNIRWCSGTLTFDTGCMTIQTKQDTNKDGDYSDGGEVTTLTNGTDVPCGSAVAGTRKSLVVDVQYRIRIDIPFWASPQMTASGTGEFACEKQS